MTADLVVRNGVLVDGSGSPARRDGDGMPLEKVVHQLTRRPATHFGFADRGPMAPGMLADLNVIDFDHLACSPPEIVADLPAGGRRLLQAAQGYRWTIKRGEVTFENGSPTGQLPGLLVRGAQAEPLSERRAHVATH